jgi:protein TonB
MVVLLVTWAPKQSVQTAAAPVAQPVTVEQTAVEPATVEQVKPRVTAPPVKAPVAKKPEAPAAESPSTAAPKLLSGPTPAYPIDAPPLTVATTLKVRIRVGKDGRVIDASVIDGDPLLNSIALEAVRTWTYEPLVLNGVPMEATIETDVVFEPIRKKK